MNDFGKILGIDNINALKEGAKLARKKSGNGCVLCDYFGYVNGPFGKLKMCECAKEKMYKELFIKANIPKAFHNKSIDDWNTRTDSSGNDLGSQQTVSERVYSLLKHYEKSMHHIMNNNPPNIVHSGGVRDPLHSITFEGKNNSGKTFIAAVMVQTCIRKGFTAKYYDWSDVNSLLSDYEKKDELDEVISDFKNLDFIALDGVEYYNYMAPQSVASIDRLSKSRINSGKPIFIFSLGNINQINGGSGWKSLLNKCLTIRLPQTIK